MILFWWLEKTRAGYVEALPVFRLEQRKAGR